MDLTKINYMTNEQALNISAICGVLTFSKQLSYGVSRILKKNSKIGTEVSAEIKEIKEIKENSEKTEESLKEELEKFGKEDFKGDFLKIKSSFVFDIKHEVIDFNGSTLGGEPFEVKYALSILDENDLIED